MLAPVVLAILSLGDSYTIGEGVAPEQRWPMQMAGAMRSLGLEVQDPTIVARTGWTTDELQAGIAESKLASRYDWVTVLIGVNNQYRGRDVEEYRKQLAELLSFAIDKSGGNPNRVVALSIPDWGVTPFAKDRDAKKIAAAIDTFNRVKREECERLGIHFVDITDISREASESDNGLLADDGLHPSGAMYRRWVERVVPIIKSELKIK